MTHMGYLLDVVRWLFWAKILLWVGVGWLICKMIVRWKYGA